MGLCHRDYDPGLTYIIDHHNDNDERQDAADIKESTVTDTTTTPTNTTEQESEQRTRRRRVASVEIPDEIHALCTLTGQDPVAVIESIVAAEVATIQAKAKAALVIGAVR